mmetsp:Transcript_45921/g.109365  ORF Transcript_45921/g.109365 Transcript_45921/m.109365 type:complete len:210 (-) Transcript_45921:171-800(-)
MGNHSGTHFCCAEQETDQVMAELGSRTVCPLEPNVTPCSLRDQMQEDASDFDSSSDTSMHEKRLRFGSTFLKGGVVQEEEVARGNLVSPSLSESTVAGDTLPSISPTPSFDADEYLQFTVFVRRSSQQRKLGMKIRNRVGEELIRIQRIDHDGLVSAWNAAHPDQTVHAGDAIIDVCGIKHHNGMRRMLEDPSEAELLFTVQRIVCCEA